MPSRRLKIRFYRAEPRRVRDVAWPGNQFPVRELVDAIRAREGNADRYVDPGGYTTMGLRGNSAPAYTSWSLYKVRHDELPDEEQDGAVGRAHTSAVASGCWARHHRLVVTAGAVLVLIALLVSEPRLALVAHASGTDSVRRQ